MFQKAAMAGGDGAGAGAGAAATAAESVEEEAAQAALLRMAGTPDAASWALFKRSYNKLAKDVRQLRSETKYLRRTSALQAGQTSTPSAPASALQSRRARPAKRLFKPRRASTMPAGPKQ